MQISLAANCQLTVCRQLVKCCLTVVCHQVRLLANTALPTFFWELFFTFTNRFVECCVIVSQGKHRMSCKMGKLSLIGCDRINMAIPSVDIFRCHFFAASTLKYCNCPLPPSPLPPQTH